MSNYPDGMTKSDWDHVEGVGMLAPLETCVLRAVVYLTYNGRVPEDEDDEGIDVDQSPSDAERDIARALRPRDSIGAMKRNGLTYLPDNVEVVDAEYMSEAEADNHD